MGYCKGITLFRVYNFSFKFRLQFEQQIEGTLFEHEWMAIVDLNLEPWRTNKQTIEIKAY